MASVNVQRLRYLRRREQWSQQDTADRVGVHRVTYTRWENGLGEPPPEIAYRMAELFQVDPHYLFHPEPPPEDSDVRLEVVQDTKLRRVPLAKLQKFTAAALKATGLTLRQLASKVQGLSVQRLQELMDGSKPTAYEIQHLRTQLGDVFNPVSSIRKRILAPTPEDPLDEKLSALLDLVASLTTRLERLEESHQQLLEKLEHI